jgi:GTP-binding protein
MNVDIAELVKMGTTNEHFPTDQKPEIMLSGRSNVGKSSFINSMTNRKNLAYTSARPGKTQTLNFYNINDLLYFVDVPGYGYAKVSRKQREAFGEMIENYIQTREELKLAVLLVDFRHAPSEDDILMYGFYKYFQIPVLVIGTKVDKVGTTIRQRHEKTIKNALKFNNDDYFVRYSSETNEGRDEAWKIIMKYV